MAGVQSFAKSIKYNKKARMSRTTKFCQECKEDSTEEFRKVLELKNSNLKIYKHRNEDDKTLKKSSSQEAFVLYNTGKNDITRFELMTGLCQYKTKCYHCKTLLQRVRSLLDQLAEIKGEQIVSVCRYCKRSNSRGKCKRCEYIVNKFFCHKVKHYEDQRNSVAMWIKKVKQLLQTVLEGDQVCMRRLLRDTSERELENILQELKKPLSIREPDINLLLPENELLSLDALSESKDMLEELILKIKTESANLRSYSDDNFAPCSSKGMCICKYFIGNKLEGPQYMDLLSLKNSMPEDKAKTNTETEDLLEVKKNKLLKNKENIIPKVQKEKSPIKLKAPKTKRTLEEEMTLKFIKDSEKQKKVIKEKVKKEEKLKLPEFGELPILKVRERLAIKESSESILECASNNFTAPFEMIRGDKLVPYDRTYKDVKSSSVQPLLFKVKPVCSEIEVKKIISPDEKKSEVLEEFEPLKGIINYELSNKKFIDMGWTQLPAEKIVRKMNIYKMEPANPQYDWFKRHEKKRIMYYETGEKLADFDEDDLCKLYYKNGTIALKYSKAQELNAGQRYIIYSLSTVTDNDNPKPFTVLASFDFLGNGIIYDHYGKIRLKYNQSEGMVIDNKISPPGRWKWHTLNDPPLLQSIFVERFFKGHDTCLEMLFKQQKDDKSEGSCRIRQDNVDMLTIELENFVKEKAHKMMQKFKPFQVKMKVFKINAQFSLRILDQANIYLLFREGRTSIKLNLGMHLISNEILDTEIAEMSQVATPYDRHPPRSQSVADIQRILTKAEKIGKLQKEKQTRLMYL